MDAGRAQPIMSIERAVPLVDSRPHFNAAQKRVVEEVLTSYDRIQGLQGRAGSGKTRADQRQNHRRETDL